MYPSYLESYNNGSLAKLAAQMFNSLASCEICPRKCRVNRLKEEKGFCKTGQRAMVYSYMPHHGEEPPISGENGSGTIFFSNCNMGCVYCQNFEFSQQGRGKEVSCEELADYMLQLQDMNCHNVNFVSPTHVLPQILKALLIAIPKGFKLPIVYNTGGYELPEVICMLSGIIDIYLPDMRYSEDEMAIKYSSAPGYPVYNRRSVKLMHGQVGIAKINESGIMKRGLIIRHLVLPQNSSGTDKVMKFIADELSPETYISLMSQYFPCYKAEGISQLSRRITLEEYKNAQESMHRYGLSNGWIQESGGLDRFQGTNIKQSL